jgi:hypothetical protein
MKRARFTEEQIIAVLKDHEAGAKGFGPEAWDPRAASGIDGAASPTMRRGSASSRRGGRADIAIFSCPIHVNLIAPLYPAFRAMQKHADEGG